MLDETLCTYDRHKKEAKRIISRITNRHYQEIEKNRSEGFEIVDDLKQELRKTFRRAQTEKVHKTLRRKRMTEHFLPNLDQEAPSAPRFACREQSIQLLSRRLSLTNDSIGIKSRRNSKKLTCFDQDQLDEVLLQVQDSLKESTADKSSEQIEKHRDKDDKSAECMKDQSVQQTRNLWQKVALADQTANKTFLPMLELYVQQRLFLKNMSKQQQRTHSIITQMLLLALARRKNNKLLDALDILISIDTFFPKSNTHMQNLKSVWYLLVSTVFLEIKAAEKKQNGHRWKRDSKRSSIKAKAQMKRQKTIVIRTLASKKNFLDRVSLQLQKMELVHETSYQHEIQDQRNVVSSEEQEIIVVSRVNKNYLLSYPEPSALFPEIEGISNYGIVIINRDEQTSLFPNHYPVALSDIITQQQYVSAFCKINSLLVPEARCFNYQCSMQVNFQLILLICLGLLLGAILISTVVTQWESYTILGLVLFLIVFVALLSLKIHLTSSTGFGKSSKSYTTLKRILIELSQIYERDSIKFTLSENVDTIIISFPKTSQTEQAIFSDAQGQRSQGSISMAKLRTFKCSLNSIFLSKIDQIIKDTDSELQKQNHDIFQNHLDESPSEYRQQQAAKQDESDFGEENYQHKFIPSTEQVPPLLICEYKSEEEQTQKDNP